MTNRLGSVISVLNMKGGVGKTTISANVTRELYRNFVKKVLLIDLDPQFNLTQCTLTRAAYEKLDGAYKTVLTVMEPPSNVGLFEIGNAKADPPSVAELSVRLKRLHRDAGFLDLVPGNFKLVKYSLIQDQHKLDLVQLRFKRFVSEVRKQYDAVIIDCNPSSSFITLCALHASTHVLAPVRPDRYSVLGLELLDELVRGMPTILPKPKFGILLNGVPRKGYNAKVEVDLRAHREFGPMLFASKLYASKFLHADPDYLGFATDKKGPHKVRLAAEIDMVANEIGDWLGWKT